MSVIVNLEPWEYEWAAHVGIRRFTANWNKKDAAHYDRSRMEDDRTAQVAACVCEIAVAKHYNRYWSGSVWTAAQHDHFKTRVADVGTNIEVKRLRTRTEAPVRRSQYGKGLVLVVAKPVEPEMRSIEIFGSIKYDKAWETGAPADYDPQNTRVIDITRLAAA